MYYLIWSFEHKAWWRANKEGYTSHSEEAGRYLPGEAGDIVISTGIPNENVAVLDKEGVIRYWLNYVTKGFTE